MITRGLIQGPRLADRAHAHGDPTIGARRSMHDAIASMVASCERYAAAYAELHHAPIGFDEQLGSALLEVLRGMAALTSDGELMDTMSEIISVHALDLEE